MGETKRVIAMGVLAVVATFLASSVGRSQASDAAATCDSVEALQSEVVSLRKRLSLGDFSSPLLEERSDEALVRLGRLEKEWSSFVSQLDEKLASFAESSQSGADSEADGVHEPSLSRLLVPVSLLAATWYCYSTFKRMNACVDLRPNELALLERCFGHNFVVDAQPDMLAKQIAYRLDLWFSTNPYAKMLALLYVSIALVALGGALLYAISDSSAGDAIWESLAGVGIDWTYASAADRLAIDSARGLTTRVVAVAVSLGGMFITALLLGIVGESIADKVEDLRKGKADVLESEHTVVLGWSDKIYGVLQQLVLANESMGGGVVVILADMDKEEQEYSIAKQGISDLATRGTHIICRQGNPLVAGDLDRVSVKTARSIIVLSDESLRPDQADARSLRIALSLVGSNPTLHGLKNGCPKSAAKKTHDPVIVIEVQDVDNQPLVRLVGGTRVETIVTHDIIGRLMIQSARHPGLAHIWASLLGFEGNEFYFRKHPELYGLTFADCATRFEDAIPIGVAICDPRRPDLGSKIVVNPSGTLVLTEHCELIVVAEDDDTYAPRAHAIEQQEHLIARLRSYHATRDDEKEASKEVVLFCGWRRDMDDIVQVLDEFVCPGSELHIFCEIAREEQIARLSAQRELRKLPQELKNLTVVHQHGLLCSRRDLEERLPIEKLTSIVILADESEDVDATSKDSQALTTLLLLRDIQTTGLKSSHREAQAPARCPLLPDEEQNEQSAVEHAMAERDAQNWSLMRQQNAKCAVISEILDTRTCQLISDAGISDYVLSNSLVSMTLAMISENRSVNALLKSLMESEGSELYLRKADQLINIDEPHSFFDIVQAARCRPSGPEIVLGYQKGQLEPCINPPDKHKPQAWTVLDMFIVLAED